MDVGFNESDKILERLERKLHSEYAKASREMTKKANDYFAKFATEDEQMREKYKDGKISKREYIEWRERKMLRGKYWTGMKERLANDLVNTDKLAMAYVHTNALDTYALNMNFGTYSIEKESRLDTAFTVYNRDAVLNIAKNNPNLLPKNTNPQVDIPKDKRWNKQHINSAITQGILQGESVDKVAKRLQKVTDMGTRSAVKNARTAMTSAQNAGRLDSMRRAKERGISVKKAWMATLDSRTRDSHKALDGEVRNLDEEFSNGLMHPGDPNGDPSEVYNCFIPETKIGVDSRIIRSYKHRYEGEIISIKSALGVNFSCTPNHPILTDRGWIAAKFLNEGDNLVVTSGVNNEVSRRNPNINHAFPRIDTIHQLFDELGGKRTSDLRVNFHGDIPTSEVEIITQKGFLWYDLYSSIRKGINKFLLKYADAPLMRKCSFVKHFRCIMRTTFNNVSGVCKSFPFFFGSMRHSDIHGLRAVTDGNVVFGKDTLNNLPTYTVLPSEMKNGLASKVFLDNIVSVERSDFVGHVYNLQTDDNYYFVNSRISKNDGNSNGIMAIAHNCRCRLVHEYDRYSTDWTDMRNRYDERLGGMSYDEWKSQRTQKTATKEKLKEEQPKTNKEYEADVAKLLKEIHTTHRALNHLENLPAEDIGDEWFQKNSDFGSMDARTAKAFTETLSDLSKQYDTSLGEVARMQKLEFLEHKNAFAYVEHDYELDVSKLHINPIKCGDYEKLVDRIKELTSDGYAVKIDEKLAHKYVATHEFAHTLIDMQTPLRNKRNWVKADYPKIKKARKEIEAVYTDYLDKRQKIEAEFQKYELDFLNTFSQASADKAVELEKQLNAMTVSKYGNENSDEFMAECFTLRHLGVGTNEYADRIMNILDKYFGRK